jgi:lipoate-protein ligase A
MEWKIIFDQPLSAQENMDKDAFILEQMGENSSPVLRFYQWIKPCATYGYFTKPEEFLNLNLFNEEEFELGRRPTGGGIIFHLSDLAFSVCVPITHPAYSLNTLDNYAYVNQRVAAAIMPFIQNHPNLLKKETSTSDPLSKNFCMAKPTIYDVMIDDKKVGGAAQRRTKKGLLHQGSLSLVLPNKQFLKKILKSDQIAEEMKSNSFEFSFDEQNLNELKDLMQKRLVEKICG